MKGLKQIRSRIEEACRKSGRSPSDVTLIAVAKSQPIEKIREAIQAGVIDIGENYAQELLEHVGALLAAPLLHPHNPPVSPLTLRGDEKVCWHFIGHLQRNKVRQIIDRVELIHSVDSFQLAREINKQARKIGKGQKILLE
ncbi:MAG: hypothetical protein HYY44_00015, partial [Deltaproteobacteria bacterium]|nr:hypothetical protein [Deltaproteobacteria bacterium]